MRGEELESVEGKLIWAHKADGHGNGNGKANGNPYA
jgi:hypothetical protein